jgi:hypothetical protein
MKVVHWKKDKFDVYIGRGSKWGNPFSHKDGTKAVHKTETRERAVYLYLKYITLGSGYNLLYDIHELEGKTVGCWCSPNLCHGNVLVDLIKLVGQYPLPSKDDLVTEYPFSEIAFVGSWANRLNQWRKFLFNSLQEKYKP